MKHKVDAFSGTCKMMRYIFLYHAWYAMLCISYFFMLFLYHVPQCNFHSLSFTSFSHPSDYQYMHPVLPDEREIYKVQECNLSNKILLSTCLVWSQWNHVHRLIIAYALCMMQQKNTKKAHEVKLGKSKDRRSCL